eukprot:TRINITY_DN2670_c0_g1_i4.p2 TRINITY_DN2670_c0_g1~~TRINITY_DN2670_c0_g1_i4.p2  ORF type:complete len:167 (+),score=4.45 TRINITY_DN2670_c0_g1_i4:84-584(+)
MHQPHRVDLTSSRTPPSARAHRPPQSPRSARPRRATVPSRQAVPTSRGRPEHAAAPPGQVTAPPYTLCILCAPAHAASRPSADAPPGPCAQGRAAPAVALWFAAAGAPAACSSFSKRIRSRRRPWDSAAASLFISRRMRYSSARHASSAAFAPLQAPKNLVNGCPS